MQCNRSLSEKVRGQKGNFDPSLALKHYDCFIYEFHYKSVKDKILKTSYRQKIVLFFNTISVRKWHWEFLSATVSSG